MQMGTKDVLSLDRGATPYCFCACLQAQSGPVTKKVRSFCRRRLTCIQVCTCWKSATLSCHHIPYMLDWMQVFFDITAGNETAGRVVIGLYAGELCAHAAIIPLMALGIYSHFTGSQMMCPRPRKTSERSAQESMALAMLGRHSTALSRVNLMGP